MNKIMFEEPEFKLTQQENGNYLLQFKQPSLLDGEIKERLSERLGDWSLALEDNVAPKMIVDLSNVKDISSAFLGSFVVARKMTEGRKGRIVLNGPSGDVVKIMDNIGFSRIFPVTETMADTEVEVARPPQSQANSR